VSSIENRALPIRITHISASDQVGGAANAAFRLHQGLLRVGVDSKMVVSVKRSTDARVQVANPTRTFSERVRRRLKSRGIPRALRRYSATRPRHVDYFSDDRSSDPQGFAGDLFKPDVYNLHWIAGFIDYTTFFGRLPHDKPLVWTLHDMNPFTGGCHYASGCSKFAHACGACPQLGSTNSMDLAARIFHRKQVAYEGLSPELVRLVAPSKWLAGEVKRSALFRRFDVSMIPHGIDTDLFKPRNKSCAREVFGIPPNHKIVMFVADHLESYRKGMDLLMAALDPLDLPFEVGLIMVGSGRPPENTCQMHFSLGRVASERLLSFAYSAADIFVIPTREDNSPLVVYEAMACGTPVVGFDVGGIPDLIRPGINGALVPPEDVRRLREAIETLLLDDELRVRMGHESRRIAVDEYRLEIQGERYQRVYEELLAQCKETDLPSAIV
jgi:glycosyltransferase involved in cell wall biosynthesis